MITRLGQNVARRSKAVAWLWATACAGLVFLSPDWTGLLQNDEFAFLNAEAPSRRAEQVFREAFPLTIPPTATPGNRRDRAPNSDRQPRLQDPLRSNLVIVVVRKDRGREGLQPEDFEFVEEHLRPSLEQIAETTHLKPRRSEGDSAGEAVPERVILDLWTPTHPQVGPLLESEDNKAVLVVLELSSSDFDRGNDEAIARIEALLNDQAFRQLKPPGLDLVLSGTAVVSRDFAQAEERTARQVEWIALTVIGLLMTLLYRAPLLTLATLGCAWLSVHAAIGLIGLLAEWQQGTLDSGLPTSVRLIGYLTVAVLSIYVLSDLRDQRTTEAAEPAPVRPASRRPLLTGLALLVNVSLLGLTASEFGRLRLSGLVLPLVSAMAATTILLWLPELVRCAGRLAFWPDIRRERLVTGSDWMPSLRLTGRLGDAEWRGRASYRAAEWLRSHRLLATVGGMALVLPALTALLRHDDLNYGKLAQLPVDVPSVAGALAVTEQDSGAKPRFPAGITGATTLLLKDEQLDLIDDSREGRQLSRQIADRLWADAEALGLADIRCEAYPWGMSERAMEIPAALVGRSMVGLRTLLPAKGGIARTRVINKRAHDAYTSTEGSLSGHVMRIDLVFNRDPLTADAVDYLSAVEQVVREELPEARSQMEIYALGLTASLRDLKSAADQDRWRLPLLAAISSLIVLSVVTRRPLRSVALVTGIGIGGLAALGLARLLLAWSTTGSDTTLDWNVPVVGLSLVIAFAPLLLVDLLSRWRRGDSYPGEPPDRAMEDSAVAFEATIAFVAVMLSLLASPLAGAKSFAIATACGVLLATTIVRLTVVLTSPRSRDSSTEPEIAPEHLPQTDTGAAMSLAGSGAPFAE